MNLSWEMLFGVGALLLLAALVYGMWQYQTRNRANDRITEEATREEYSRPDSYTGRSDDLRKDLGKS